jgi:TonB family protein
MTQSRPIVFTMSALMVALLSGAVLAAQDSKPLPPPASPGQAIQDAAKAAAHDPTQDRPKGGTVEILYGAAGKAGTVEILNSTQGIDFHPYLEKIWSDVRRNWNRLTPAYARKMRGKVTIEFAVLPDGHISAMKLVSGSGDYSLDRAAWDGIRAAGPFAALPKEFTGPNLRLRYQFLYNTDKP